MANKNRINERLKITVIGCGQCGCQVTSEIESAVANLDGNKNNVSFVGINTSTEDLASISLSHKIHIENSKGAACDRERSVTDLASNIDGILDELKNYIIEDSIVFIATSLGGGTGSSIAPVLAEILLDLGYTVGMIVVLPADTESLKIRDNARQAFDEIEQLKPRMGSIFILDNNSTNKVAINRTFASLFIGVLCISNKSTDGNMDLAEIEACLKCPSFSVITKTNAEKGTTSNIVDILNRDNNIFAKRESKVVSIMAISEASNARDSQINIVELRKEVGTAPTEFHGYLSESGENVIILSGLQMPYSRIDAMTDAIEKEASVIQSSMDALTSVRESRSINVFSKRVEPEKVVTPTSNTSTMSALDRLKAKRITK